MGIKFGAYSSIWCCYQFDSLVSQTLDLQTSEQGQYKPHPNRLCRYSLFESKVAGFLRLKLPFKSVRNETIPVLLTKEASLVFLMYMNPDIPSSTATEKSL